MSSGVPSPYLGSTAGASDNDHAFSKTKRERIHRQLCQGIASGKYPVGSYLPTVRALGKEFEASITPVYQAIGLLEKEGMVKNLPGYGFQVLPSRLSSTASLSARSRPLVEAVTTLKIIGDKPIFGHQLPAAQEAMILKMRSDSRLRLSLVTVDTNQGNSFLSLISEAIDLKPQVFAFCEPEKLSQAEIDQLLALRKAGTHVVYRASWTDIPECDRVVSDFDQGQYDLTRHVLGLGHKECLFIGVHPESAYQQAKESGYQRALAQAGAPDERTQWVTNLEPDFLDLPPRSKMTLLIGLLTMELKKRPITAIFCPDDNAVAPCRVALQHINREDILVAGYDNIWQDLQKRIMYLFGDEMKDTSPPLTVDTCLTRVGEAIADLTLERADGTLRGAAVVRHVPQKLVVPG